MRLSRTASASFFFAPLNARSDVVEAERRGRRRGRGRGRRRSGRGASSATRRAAGDTAGFALFGVLRPGEVHLRRRVPRRPAFWNSGRSQRTRPLLLLVGALAVQRDEALEDLLVGEVVRPAVGVEDGGVEVVVDLLQDRDEPLLVDDPLLRRQRLARPELLEDVVHPGDREVGVERLLALAVRVEGFAEGADAGRSGRRSRRGRGRGRSSGSCCRRVCPRACRPARSAQHV